jgi:hypothetical protein
MRGKPVASIVEYIETTELRGDGQTQATALRRVQQLWTKDGKLVAEYDPHTRQSKFNPEGIE